MYNAAGWLRRVPRSARSLAIVFPVLIASGSCRAASTDRDYAVTGIDYAFQIPDTVRAGSAIVRFHNAGAVPHELAMALLKPGITVPRVLEVLKAGGSPDSLIDGVVGILIAQPGSDPMGRLAVNFQAGRTYALFCNFQDSPDKPPHSALGMVRSLDIPEPD